MPSLVKLQTKIPISFIGTTPLVLFNKTDVISAVFSLKCSAFHSIGLSIDYLYLSHNREGFQNSDHPLRSVSPGHVTNQGTDHSKGMGLSLGWRWKVTEHLDFGVAWTKKTYCGQFRKYRGFEPHYAKNYTPQVVGAGITYRFTSKFSGRIEVLWSNLGNLPDSNNNILPDGRLNLNKRGSKNSPGPGLSDATFINLGIGYKCNATVSFGGGFSHRIKLTQKNSNLLSHTAILQTIYETLSLGVNFNNRKQVLFLGISYGFKNRTSRLMPIEFGGGRFIAEKQNASVSVSWGYLFGD